MIEEITPSLIAQGRLIRLSSDLPVVYVGDTHGDRTASECVFDRFPIEDHRVVFLGDAVDRGPDSAGNLELILRMKREHPDRVYLLQGNHESRAVSRFTPADFWESLSAEEAQALGAGLSNLPYAAWHPAGALAVHGALPNVPSLESLASIQLGSPAWRALTWGDWNEDFGAERNSPPSRPQFTRRDFEARSARLGVRLLLRSHQPKAPLRLFNDRCLTIFTSSAYGGSQRNVAVLPAIQHVETIDDLTIVPI